MGDTGGSLKSDSATSVSTHSILILDRHDFLREIALVHVKIKTVHSYQFRECDVICLLIVVRQGVSEYENSFLGCMRMEVDVDLKVLILGRILRNSSLGGPNSWMVFLKRITVESIQVLSHCIKSVVATSYAVWVQSRDYFEHIIFPEKATLLTFEICDEIKSSIKHM